MTVDSIEENENLEYYTDGGVFVSRTKKIIEYKSAFQKINSLLDNQRGAIFSSNYVYQNKYSRWTKGIINPPISISSRKNFVDIDALNERGVILLKEISNNIKNIDCFEEILCTENQLMLNLKKDSREFLLEEERSRVSSVFTILRSIVKHFFSKKDNNLGLYGAFGYDLAFQFNPIELKIDRSKNQRDLVLYIPDSILIIHDETEQAWINYYDFTIKEKSTKGLPRNTEYKSFIRKKNFQNYRDHPPGEYSDLVRKAKSFFKEGDLFEVVISQTFHQSCIIDPSMIFQKLKYSNPSPYSFFINLGNQEYLIGTSPEMFIRVSDNRVETCPISGTIKRGDDAISDADNILKILNSEKEKSELTMCSDVDRNDKNRVCKPNSVKIISRRQIEIYSRLIHTVDHIEGYLKNDMDSFDAFLSHAWSVTVTGAPKISAMRFIENNEKTSRSWYGGAIGISFFNGNMDTGLTLRAIHIKDGIASVRSGATLLFDSIPEEEEKETELKASALVSIFSKDQEKELQIQKIILETDFRILIIDHEDSFVHTLANYFRNTGAKVITIRAPISEEILIKINPHLLVLSPGPGKPKDFNCSNIIRIAIKYNISIFGVCLGLQAIVETFGGSLKSLKVPFHGKSSKIRILKSGIMFSGFPENIVVGRYHSLYADRVTLPKELIVTSETEDGIVMSIEHQKYLILAVQFHPESLMTLQNNIGMRIIQNIVFKVLNKKK